MRKLLVIVIALLLVGTGIYLLYTTIFNNPSSAKGALHVTSNMKAQVMLNNQYIGDTPVCKCQNELLSVGEYDLKIIPEDTTMATFTTKVRVEPGVLTAVDRTFLPGSLASSYIITLEKTDSPEPQLLVTSIPEGALVSIDSNPSGVTPLAQDSVSASEHEVEIQKQGFSKKTIRIRTVPHYKLVINAILGAESDIQDEIQQQATTSPTPTQDESTNTLTIDDTPTGFLRVRSGAGRNFEEIGQVEPGETFSYSDEENGWYEITLSDGEKGWVSGDYVTLSNP